MLRLTGFVITAVVCYAQLIGAEQAPINTGDVDCSGEVNIADLSHMVSYLFFNGEAPCDFISPGIAFAERTMEIFGPDVDTLPCDQWTTILSVEITVPANGFVSPHLFANVYALNSPYRSASVAIDTIPDSDGLVSSARRGGTEGDSQWGTVALTHVLPVTTGTHTFYASAKPASGCGLREPIDITQARLPAPHYPFDLNPEFRSPADPLGSHIVQENCRGYLTFMLIVYDQCHIYYSSMRMPVPRKKSL